jgi:hypothetical protein
MAKALLTIVTTKVINKTAAQLLAANVVAILGDSWCLTKCNMYPKFEASYKLELETKLPTLSQEQMIAWSIACSNQLVSPWLVYFDEDTYTIELIFNANSHTSYKTAECQCIRWAHWQLTD